MPTLSLTKRAARFFAAVAIIAVAIALSGCGASLTVYDYYDGDAHYNVYELAVDADTVAYMESSAAVDEHGSKYTVAGYFFKLFTDSGFELTDAISTPEDGYAALFTKRLYDGEQTLFGFGTPVEYELDHTDGAFTRTIERVSPNPFNGVREQYDAIVDPDKSATVLQKLKNGVVVTNEYGERSVLFPSLTAAFPYLNNLDPEGVELNYAILGSSRTDSSGRTVEAGSGNVFHVFSRYFDRSDADITLKYTRPVPWGWYLVALALGGAVVAVIYLVTREKKEKPTLLDRFPYNPEEYRDYENHLPSSR